MRDEIRFEIPLAPRPKQRPRFFRLRGKKGRVVTVTPAKTRRAEADLVVIAAQHAPSKPFAGGIGLFVLFELPYPQSWPKWKKRDHLLIPPTGRPDLDNLLKLLMDALTRSGRWWRDDAQIVCVTASKKYSETPRTIVHVEHIECHGSSCHDENKKRNYEGKT